MNDQTQTSGSGKDETFDASAFMSSTVDQPMETEYQICPEGTFKAVIDDFDEKAIEKFDFTYKKGPNTGKPGSMIKLSLPWSILDDTVLAQLGRERMTVVQQIILDMGSNGGLDWGKDKNIDLGRVRAAVGQNTPGAWQIPSLRGAGPAMVKVEHETFKRRDGSEGKRANVTRVVELR